MLNQENKATEVDLDKLASHFANLASIYGLDDATKTIYALFSAEQAETAVRAYLDKITSPQGIKKIITPNLGQSGYPGQIAQPQSTAAASSSSTGVFYDPAQRFSEDVINPHQPYLAAHDAYEEQKKKKTARP